MARLKLSVVLKSGACIGPGKACLLESIRGTGSISAAARNMGISYAPAERTDVTAEPHSVSRALHQK